jgi:predicted GNAT family acetyltransferase
MKYEEIPVNDRPEIHNFEFFVEGYRSFIDYLKKDNKLYLIHTEVPAELEGKGVAATFVEKVFLYLEERGKKIVPLCPYVQFFLKRHPEWNDRIVDHS